MKDAREQMMRRREAYLEFSQEKERRLGERKRHIQEETRIFEEEYKQFLEDMLIKYNLDARVIRDRDGQEGELHVEENPNISFFMPFGYKFYPVTKKGKLAQKSSGSVFDLVDYIPKNN